MKKLEEMSQEELVTEVKNLRSRKKYGLVWEEKLERVVSQCNSELPVFKEIEKKNILKSKNDRNNLIIEGDNFHALSVLNYTHRGKIDVIYIDPPYNTGNKDFLYNDQFVDYEDSYRHSKWISFMEKRLSLAYELLSNKGVMFISIDNNEIAQLRMLCDSLMPGAFVTTIQVQMSTAQGQKVKAAKTGNLVKNGEYILVYSKSRKKNIGKRVLYEPTEYDIHYAGFLNEIESGIFKEVGLEKILTEEFADELKVLKLLGSNSKLPKSKIKDAYSKSEDIKDFIHKNADRIVRRDRAVPIKPSKKQLKAINDGYVVNYQAKSRDYLMAKDRNGKYTQVFRLSEKIRRCHDYYASYGISTIRGDWWPGFYLDMGNVSKEGGIKFENGKKPVRLIEQLIYFCADKNSTVLDFFGGSGTTAHAVLNLNKNENFDLKFILCTYNEEGKKAKVMDEFCYPRIKNVVNGYSNQEAIPTNVRYLKTDFVQKSKVSDDTRHKLVERATEMICVKEDTFEKKYENKKYKIYENQDRSTGILYDLDSLGEFKKKLAKIGKDCSIYVFSLTNETFASDFEDLDVKHKLTPIPESILEVYRKLFG